MANITTTGTTGYPSVLDTRTTLVDGSSGDEIVANHPNGLGAAVIAIETELGTLPKGTLADVKTRLAVVLNDDGTLKTLAQNLLFTDATYDIGASGATRPRDLFLSRTITIGTNLSLSSASPRIIGGSTATLFYNNANTLENMRLTDAGVLAIGTATTTGGSSGDIVHKNSFGPRGLNSTGTGTVALAALNASNIVELGAAANSIRLYSSDITSSTYTVSSGAADSGGAGFRYLRVPN